MAHYQRREWQQALDYFRQVKDVDPAWPGLESLIDEASWFLQLESVDARPDEQPPLADSRDTGRGRSALRWLLPLVVGLAAVAVLAWWQGWIPGIGNRLERESLRNRGQASLAAGNYQGAAEAFAELASLAPGDPAAQEGLERAARLEQLARDFQEAETAAAAENWDVAEAKLQAVLAVDATFDDAAARLAYVRRQQAASEVFKAGIAAYDAGERQAAITSLERLSELDPQYQRDAVRELLFVLYMQDGQAITATPNATADQIRQAAGRFGQALALHPYNVQALDESRLVSQYLEGIKALDQQSLPQAETLLNAILAERPQYANGQAAALYYDLLVRKGDTARANGDLDQAYEAYETAVGWATTDSSAARAGLAALQAVWTPTPEPVALPTPFVESQTDTLNIRLGPGTDYPAIGQVVAGTTLALLGRNAAGDWLVVCCVDEKPGWVATRLVRTDAIIADLPVGLPPQLSPTATLAPTPTRRAASAATPTPATTVQATPTIGVDTDTPPVEPPTPTPEPPTPEPPTPTPEPR
jgi:tetratricopeptide (TPR) repeat protein